MKLRVLAVLALVIAAVVVWAPTRDHCASAWDAAREQAAADLHCPLDKVTGGTQWAGCTVLRFQACGAPVEYSCRARDLGAGGVVFARFGYRCLGGPRTADQHVRP